MPPSPHRSSRSSCLVYTRVSTEHQARYGYSLRAQEDACRKLAADVGLTVAEIFTDGGESGTSFERPRFQDLIDRVRVDRTIAAVIVLHTDRFARNVLDHLTVKSILRSNGVALRSVLQPMADESPEGALLDTIMASINEFYARDLSRKVTRGLTRKAAEGGWPAPAPFGYRNATDPETGARVVVAVPEDAALVRMAFERYAEGKLSVARLAGELFTLGMQTRHGKRLTVQRMLDLLRNSFYIGLVSWDGKVYDGRHDPVVPARLFYRVQQVLRDHNRGADRSRKHTFLLTGLLRCGACGSALTGERHPLRNGSTISYYRCMGPMRGNGCKERPARVEVVDAAIRERIEPLTFSPEGVAAMEAMLEATTIPSPDATAHAAVLRGRIRSLEAKERRLDELVLVGAIDVERVQELREGIRVERAACAEELTAVLEHTEPRPDTGLGEVLAVLTTIAEEYDRLGVAEQKERIQVLFERIMVRNGTVEEAAWREEVGRILNKTEDRLAH